MISLSSKYVGIPYRFQNSNFSGCDCWGLVRLYFARELHIILPSFIIEKDDPEVIEKKIFKELDRFKEIKKEDVDRNDLILLRIGKYPVHIGIALDARFMLHSLNGHNSCIESFTKNKWSIRTVGFYRWT